MRDRGIQKRRERERERDKVYILSMYHLYVAFSLPADSSAYRTIVIILFRFGHLSHSNQLKIALHSIHHTQTHSLSHTQTYSQIDHQIVRFNYTVTRNRTQWAFKWLAKISENSFS